jgi:hypothetical protein
MRRVFCDSPGKNNVTRTIGRAGVRLTHFGHTDLGV